MTFFISTYRHAKSLYEYEKLYADRQRFTPILEPRSPLGRAPLLQQDLLSVKGKRQLDLAWAQLTKERSSGYKILIFILFLSSKFRTTWIQRVWFGCSQAL